jgi:hypothetical protein
VKWHVEAAEPTFDTDNLVGDPGISDTKWASTVSLAPLAVSNGRQEPHFGRALFVNQRSVLTPPTVSLSNAPCAACARFGT